MVILSPSPDINHKHNDIMSITKKALTKARDRLQTIKEEAELLRAEELKIRNYLADQLHTEEEGSKTVTIEGIKVTISRPVTRSITKEDAERLCQDHTELSKEALRWKPKIVVSVAKKHPELEDYYTSKPGLPTVTFA